MGKEMTINRLTDFYGIAASIERGKVKLFDRKSSIDIIAACSKERIGVLGIEGFFVEGSELAPQMDWIADFSESYTSKSYEDYVDQSLGYALAFFGLDGFDERLVFEFILK